MKFLVNLLRIDNTDMILSNKKVSYNKVDLGYQPNNNAKSFISICHVCKKKKL